MTEKSATATAGSIEALRFRLSAVLAEIEAVSGEVTQALAHAKDSIHRAFVAVEVHFGQTKDAVKAELDRESAALQDDEAAAVATAALGAAQ